MHTDPEALINYVQKDFPDYEVSCCYVHGAALVGMSRSLCSIVILNLCGQFTKVK